MTHTREYTDSPTGLRVKNMEKREEIMKVGGVGEVGEIWEELSQSRQWLGLKYIVCMYDILKN